MTVRRLPPNVAVAQTPTVGFELIMDPQAVDDLVDLLWRLGSAQDYPKPEIPRDDTDHRRIRWSKHTDLRSRTADEIILGEAPVPGYADFPAHLVVDYGPTR